MTKWITKKMARRSVAVGTWAARRLGAQRLLEQGPCVRAITYHRFGDEWPRDPFCVRLGEFETQMRWLAQTGLAVSIDDVEAFVAGRRQLPDGAILVTIDDGVRSVYTRARPILAHYGIPAVMYAAAGLISSDLPGPTDDEPYMTWDELNALTEAGLTIGSHSYSHRSLGKISLTEARDEAERSRDMLESRLGRPVLSFAYPYGTPAHYSADTTRVLAEAGYTTAFISTHGAIRPGFDPVHLPRVKIEGGEDLWMFQNVCAGAMDPWAVIDHAVCHWRDWEGRWRTGAT
jgi:peptidoglycan/xylan/chitin deacetylase (PgdA/CDA1 family)